MLLKDYDLTKAEQFKENMIKEHENKIKEIDDVIDQLKKHSPAETLAERMLNEISFDSAYNFCQIYKNRMAYHV